MRRRRLLLGLGAVALLGFAVGLFAWVHLSMPGISHRNYERIQFGMTEKEVEQLLGVSAEDAKTQPYAGSYDPREFQTAGVVQTKFWCSEELTVQVGFDAHGAVAWKAPWMAPISIRRAPKDESLAGRLRRLLPW